MVKRKSRKVGTAIGISILFLTGCNTKPSTMTGNQKNNSSTTITTIKQAAQQNVTVGGSQAADKTPQTSPAAYSSYKNARFGFRLRVPSTYTKQPAPEDGDGASWTNKNSIRIEAYGQYNGVKQDSVTSVLYGITQHQHPSYQQRGSDWLVVSGIDKSGRIYYTKIFVGASKNYTLKIQYPQSQRAKAAEMVKAVESSFQPGPLHFYVFSQSMLKLMYVVEYFRSVGPIFPSQTIQNEVNKWAPKVSMQMLSYVPVSQRPLDKKLIQNIQGASGGKTAMKLLHRLPGYTLKHAQLPSGARTYWYPKNGVYPKWVNPVKK